MHLIGFWLGSLKDLQFCHPQEVVGELAPEVRSRLADYLDAGDCWTYFMGFSWCRFHCSVPQQKQHTCL